MAARPRRRGWRRPGSLGCDDVPVAHGVVSDGEFEHPVENHPAATGAATVEAEHEFIQVACQMGAVYGALVGAQQPTLGQRSNAMHPG
jgi:hypothetical protein